MSITSKMTTEEKRKLVIKTLKRELGSVEAVRSFSQTLKSLNICNLADDKDLEAVTQNEGAYLYTLVTYYSFGLLSKLEEIKNKVQGE